MHDTPTSTGTGRLDTLWANLSTADKHVLLGHANPTLTTSERLRFAKLVTALGARARRQGQGRREPRGRGAGAQDSHSGRAGRSRSRTGRR